MTFERWDSAGIWISETSGAVQDTTLPWVVDPEPDLEIGGSDQQGAGLLFQVMGIASAPDGGLIVVNAGSQELRWFDAAGEHLITLGGAGDGPGEYRRPRLVPQFESDSLLVFDSGLRRFTWIARDGTGYRVQAPPSAGRQLLQGAPVVAQGTAVVFRSMSAACLLEEYCETPLHLRWVDVAASESDTIASFRKRFASTDELGAFPHQVDGPFDRKGLVAAGSGALFVEGERGFELRWFGADGEMEGIVRVDATTRRAGQEALERVIEEHAAHGTDPDVMRRVFARMDLPETLPAFQALLIDRMGWIWAELFRLDDEDPSTWMVFSPDGQAHGMVNLPRDLEVHVIAEDHVLGRWVDDLGVEYVRRYRLERSGS